MITAPVFLHAVHNDGYPFIMVFQDGRTVYKAGLAPYATVFDSLRGLLWPEDSIRLQLASPLKIGDNLGLEDTVRVSIWVVADGDSIGYHRLVDIARRFPHLHVRYESQLSTDDLTAQVDYSGRLEDFSFAHFANRETPITFAADSFAIGGMRFRRAETGLLAWFPNPFNPERAITLNLRRGRAYPHNWADFWVHQPDDQGNARTLLEGRFAKSGSRWTFSPGLASGPALPPELCAGTRCPGPPQTQQTKVSVEALAKGSRGPERANDALVWTLGDMPSRFPALAVQDDGTCWVTWEQSGNIIAAQLRPGQLPAFIAIETDSADSYNPVITTSGADLWAFFPCDADGFYRVYGVRYDGNEVSRAVLVSEMGPFDCETPAAVTSADGSVYVFWSELKANQRFLKYRTITDGLLTEFKPAPLVAAGPDDDYSNAWYPSLAATKDGTIWAAWNQHYPTTLGAHAGTLGDTPTTIDGEGAYSSICLAQDGTPDAVWQSWRSDDDKTRRQIISSSHFDLTSRQWSVPRILNRPDRSRYNETPKITCTADGTLWVCWSGRENYDSPWRIYLCRFQNGAWSEPEVISTGGEHARAPVMAVGSRDDLWIAWHEGAGPQMRLKIWHRS